MNDLVPMRAQCWLAQLHLVACLLQLQKGEARSYIRVQTAFRVLFELQTLLLKQRETLFWLKWQTFFTNILQNFSIFANQIFNEPKFHYFHKGLGWKLFPINYNAMILLFLTVTSVGILPCRFTLISVCPYSSHLPDYYYQIRSGTCK